ncbi:MAG: hypothetical protein ACRDY5_08380, partial [Acidimicrobiales bacterium]
VAAAGVDEACRAAGSDQEAADAVAVMSAEELAVLDDLVRQRLPRGMRDRRQVRGLELWRRIVWREQHLARRGA